MAIDGIDTIAASMTDLLFASEDPGAEAVDVSVPIDSAVESIRDDKMILEPEKAVSDDGNAEALPSDTPSVADIAEFLPSDGLNVSP